MADAEPIELAAIRARLDAIHVEPSRHGDGDAATCPRCVWLDYRMTFEANAPADLELTLGIAEQVHAMVKWLRDTPKSAYSHPSFRAADLLDAILAGDTGRLPWGGE